MLLKPDKAVERRHGGGGAFARMRRGVLVLAPTIYRVASDRIVTSQRSHRLLRTRKSSPKTARNAPPGSGTVASWSTKPGSAITI